MNEPLEIVDEEHEQVCERVAAIDVAKATGMVCLRVPDESRPGRRVSRVWEVQATTRAVIELGDHLVCQGAGKVTVESTSDYWRIWFCLLEAAGLEVQLVNAREARNVPGRPKSDKLDSVWLARHWSRLEKLLEDALIKVTAVASKIDAKSVRAMLEALIAGERSPRVLADLALGKMKAKRAALTEALTGRFDDHHAELARMLLDQVDQLDRQAGRLTGRIEELIAAIPAARGVDADGTAGPGAGAGPDAAVLPAIARLDEVPGIGPRGAQVILAEIGLDMGRFADAGHLVSWAKLPPRTIQSGARSRGGRTGKGNPYLKGILGEAAAAAAKTGSFLGERYRRLVKRIGKLKALVAVARSILVIIWHLLADPAARYTDLGAGYYASRTGNDRKLSNHIRQIQALGCTVTLTPAQAA
jgi:transposase